MGRTALCLPLALLFLASVIPSNAQSPDATEAAEAAAPVPALGAPGAADDKRALLYDVRGEITINCTIPNETKVQYVWHKNGTDVGSIGTLKERYNLGSDGSSFHIKQSVEDDYGNYSCALVGQPETNQTWAVRGRPYLKVPANSNVVEGQNLKIVCKVIGKPYPTVQWYYTNSTEGNTTYYDVSDVLGSRVKLAESEQGVPDGVLVLGPAARGDAGTYICNTTSAAQPASTVLRVKDMYAALWPFLGICAEVFVLCAIILVYEKRRTKPDLDDSDTDNHDQKKS